MKKPRAVIYETPFAVYVNNLEEVTEDSASKGLQKPSVVSCL
jgi:hypothetical protein